MHNIDDFDGLSAQVEDIQVIVINKDLPTDRIRFRQLLHYAVNEEIVTLSRGAELANKNLVDLRREVKAAV